MPPKTRSKVGEGSSSNGPRQAGPQQLLQLINSCSARPVAPTLALAPSPPPSFLTIFSTSAVFLLCLIFFAFFLLFTLYFSLYIVLRLQGWTLYQDQCLEPQETGAPAHNFFPSIFKLTFYFSLSFCLDKDSLKSRNVGNLYCILILIYQLNSVKSLYLGNKKQSAAN